ncbi:hypothetical protein [Streptomyces sp. NBC_01171]|uniref:hypothetical protein n=1 Tax=Streptomyces sp. NBC_01171 TaxID=2903757 RepID=UPI00386FCE9F|nr:hypothetical protein OG448_30220 [Streptomyces sp. NBC_01171]
MRLRQRAIAAVFMSTAVFTALAAQAMAAPMPWETSKAPTATTHHVPSAAASGSGTAIVLCSGSCYE